MSNCSVELGKWLDFFNNSLTDYTFERIVLSQYIGTEIGLEKITIRLIMIQNQQKLSFLYHYKTQDITKNYAIGEAKQSIFELLEVCKQANLWTNTVEVQLKKTKKKQILTQQKVKGTAVSQSHNREKMRYVDQQAPFLVNLGITDQSHQVIPSMARKWKQINKFIEIFSNGISQIHTQDKQINVVDFGSGKGYLTFAMYDFLQQNQWKPYITGVELRHNLVEFCQNVAEQNKFKSLDFFEGDVRSYAPEKLDVMVALHACDVATDFAIHCGIRLSASMIMCAPCCHKELRPQMCSPEVLKPMLSYGIHLGQQAEMLTDTIRAMLLNAYGYETKVFEFVALEHTSKNKMILAIKKKNITVPDPQIMKQIEEIKIMYGIQTHSLENLLLDQEVDQSQIGCKC